MSIGTKVLVGQFLLPLQRQNLLLKKNSKLQLNRNESHFFLVIVTFIFESYINTSKRRERKKLRKHKTGKSSIFTTVSSSRNLSLVT